MTQSLIEKFESNIDEDQSRRLVEAFRKITGVEKPYSNASAIFTAKLFTARQFADAMFYLSKNDRELMYQVYFNWIKEKTEQFIALKELEDRKRGGHG